MCLLFCILKSQIVNTLKIAVFQLKPSDPFKTAKIRDERKQKKTSIEGMRPKIIDFKHILPIKKNGAEAVGRDRVDKRSLQVFLIVKISNVL